VVNNENIKNLNEEISILKQEDKQLKEELSKLKKSMIIKKLSKQKKDTERIVI